MIDSFGIIRRKVITYLQEKYMCVSKAMHAIVNILLSRLSVAALFTAVGLAIFPFHHLCFSIGEELNYQNWFYFLKSTEKIL